MYPRGRCLRARPWIWTCTNLRDVRFGRPGSSGTPPCVVPPASVVVRSGAGVRVFAAAEHETWGAETRTSCGPLVPAAAVYGLCRARLRPTS
eukprot:6102157-Pyramimonas_sp.AAC.1